MTYQHLKSSNIKSTAKGQRGITYRYRVELSTEGEQHSPGGSLRYALRVRAAGGPATTAKEIPVEVSFRYHKAIRGPTSATLSRAAKDREVRVRLWSGSDKLFTITKIDSSLPNLRAKAASQEAASAHEIALSWSNEGKQQAGAVQKATIDVHTLQHPDAPYRVTVLVLP